MGEAFIYDGVRTPFGRYGGGLAAVRPDDLAAHVVSALLSRHADLDPVRIDEVIFGDANQAGEDNRNVARMATLLAGLPTSIPGTTVNRLCGSSLDAVMQASRMIECGDGAACWWAVWSRCLALRMFCSSPSGRSRPVTRGCTQPLSVGGW